MTIISFDDVLKLKQACSEKFKEHVHFHDACGGQYFTLETNSDEIREFIKEFLLKMDYKVNFDKSGMSFTLDDT